jgi:hypothetical protein
VIERRVLRIRRRIAVARFVPPVVEESRAEQSARRALEPHIDQLCWDWARWDATRKFYGRAPQPASILAQFGRERIRSTATDGGPNAQASSLLARFHQAVISGDELARAAFEGYYLYRVRPIKKLAALLHCDRTHVYWLRSQHARRAYAFATK